jgi:hypothetical protein
MDLEEAMDRYAHRADAGSIAAFAMDPPAFYDEYARRTIERLVARAPVRDGERAASRATLVRYYEKLAYLDPQDQGARRELAALQRDARKSAAPEGVASAVDAVGAMRGARYANLDPNALYRVVLESIDPARANDASFALTLSMKLRSPLPRVKSLVKNMPARVSDRMSYKAAMHLARIIEELGGRARLDVCPAEAPKRAPAKATETAARAGNTCPQCGWVDEDGAEFCEVCLQRFAGPEPVTFDQLTQSIPAENPLAETPVRRSALSAYWGVFMGLTPRTRLTLALALLSIVVLVMIAR